MEPSSSPSPSQLPSSCRSFLDHPDIDSHILTPSPADPSAAVHGPTLTTFPNKTFSDFLPLPNRHKHPFLLTSAAVDCSVFLRASSRFLRYWPNVDDSFRLWAYRILFAREDVLRRQRIYSLIHLSLVQVNCDVALLGAASLFWSVGYNVFYFPCGPMSVTLRDVEAICGTRSHGEEIDGMLRPLRGMPSVIKKSRGYAFFLAANCRNSGEVTDEEFVAFLLYWICKYLLCVSSDKIVMEHLVLAACLTEERPLNLSGYLLANLYSGMYTLISCLARGRIGCRGISCTGPIWLLQFWLHLYFPAFRFNEVSPKEATRQKGCYWEELVKIRPCGMSFRECYSVFSSHARSDGDFFILSEDNELVYYGNALIVVYGNALIPRDLPRAVIWKGCRTYGVEVYCPHFCARQFGLCQSIPAPPLYTANVGFVSRMTSKHTKPIEQVKLLNKELADRFGKEFFLFRGKPCTTRLFDNWWRTVVRDTLHPNDGSQISKILVPNPHVYTFWCTRTPTHETDGQVKVKATRRVRPRRKMNNDTAKGSTSTPWAPVAPSFPYRPAPVVTTILSDEEISLGRRKCAKTNKSTELTSDTANEPSIKECNKKLDEMGNVRMDDPLYVAGCIIFCESKTYREQWMLLSTKPEEVRLAWLKMLANKLGFV